MPGILIVEDEELIRFSFSRALKNDGVSVAHAENGRTALEKIRQGMYDLAIVDLQLGDINGIDVIHHLKEISPHTKIIVISADSAEELKERLLIEGVQSIYEKPFDTYDVVNDVRQSLSITKEDKTSGRRHLERHPYTKPIEFYLYVTDESNELRKVNFRGTGVDINQKGIRIKTDQPLTPGDVVEFMNDIGPKRGVVQWSVMKDNFFRAGIVFTGNYN